MSNIQLVDLPKTSRVGRYPKHRFLTRELPFTAQPFMIAPVMPGESLEHLRLESRVVSDPVLNRIIGWKKEYHFFYVRITHLLVDAIRDMFVDPANVDLAATYGVAANDTAYYTAKGGIDFTKRALDKIVEHWFRDEGETAETYATAGGIPMVQVREPSWMDSLTDKDVMPEGAAISGATDAGDLNRLMLAYQSLRELGLRDMDYHDFLRSYGIAVPEEQEQKPEKIASFSDFSYPANTIDPSTGGATSVLSWVFRNDSKERKFFKEPGFIIGVSITRPKTYFSGLAGSAAEFLTRAWDWSPNYAIDVPETTLKYFAGDTGPLGDRTVAPDGYWLDMRDLFLYGDQFHNMAGFDVGMAGAFANHLVPLPDGSTFNRKYLTETQVKNFFVTPASAYYVQQDGYVSLQIKGYMRDATPGNQAAS